MLENICKSWRTSGAALVAALAGVFLIFMPDQSETIKKIAEAVLLIAGVIVGIFAKDSSITGTALNPRAEVVGEPTPLPSPAAAVTIAKIEATK
jgi:drug/metabolite transporter (DMT)-like permease